jgi:hypothetical protein
MRTEEPTVTCYSGHTYAQEPREVAWGGERFKVLHVECRWRTPEGPAFRVATEPGEVFDLLYVEADDCWTVALQAEDGDQFSSETETGKV